MRTVAQAAFLIVTLLSGCVLVDVYSIAKETTLDPTEVSATTEIHDEHYVRADDKKGTLYVYWYSTFAKPKQYMSGIYVYVDGKRAGAVEHNTYTAIELTPGDYKIAVGDSDSQEKEQKIAIVRSSNIYFRTGITTNMLLPDTLYLHKDENSDTARKNIDKITFVTLKI